VRVLALTSTLSIALLTFPHRKWGNHAYVVFPLLALTCGVAAAPWVERLFARRGALQALGAAVLAAWVASVAGAGRWVLQPPCVVSNEFAREFDGVPASTEILVVSPRLELLTVAELASEKGFRPRPASALPHRPDAPIALVRDGNTVPSPWRLVATARGWSLLRSR